MPNWQPNWNDVRWSHAAADALVQKLNQTAADIDRQVEVLSRTAEEAQRDWSGAHRNTFDGDFPPAIARLRALANECRRMAGSVNQNRAEAMVEQRRRERERERWKEEEREERKERERKERERKERERKEQPS